MRLVTGLQTVTRMLPADSAFHEVWLQSQLDPGTPAHLQEDLGNLIDEVSQRSFVQRHFVVVRWDADGRFQAMAGRRGQWPGGALDLMREQTVQVERRLIDAGFQKVRAMSGPQVGAVLRHLQHPGWPIDRASDVNVDTCWLPSHDEWSWTEVTVAAPDPVRPDLFQGATTWYHRTAQLPVSALEVRARDGLWMSPLLTRMDEQVVRTLSSHMLLVPASKRRLLLAGTSPWTRLRSPATNAKVGSPVMPPRLRCRRLTAAMRTCGTAPGTTALSGCSTSPSAHRPWTNCVTVAA